MVGDHRSTDVQAISGRNHSWPFCRTQSFCFVVQTTSKNWDLVKKNANGEYIRVDNTGTPVLEDGYVIVEDSGQVINALEEIIEGNITIKLIDNFNQQQSGYTLANGNLDLRTKGNIYNDGHIQARQALNLQAIHIENDYFGEISAGATQLAANTITNRGLVDGSLRKVPGSASL